MLASHFCLRIENVFLVNWTQIEYNYGNCFDGAVFTAPVDGLYIFNATAFHDSDCDGNMKIQKNYEDAAKSCRFGTDDSRSAASLTVQVTLELDKNATVTIVMHGDFEYLNDHSLTYFEGRLLASHSK